MSIRINPNIQPKFIKFEPNKVEIPTDETPVVIEGEKAPEAKETSSVSGYLDDIENNNTDSDIIYKSCIMRDSAGNVIVPDDVYDAFARTNETEPFEFAKEVAGDNADKDKLNYYAGWFAILQNEGVYASDGQLRGCSKASDYGVDLNDPDVLTEMLRRGSINLSDVTIDRNGRVQETTVDKSDSIYSDAIKADYEEYRDSKVAEIEIWSLILKMIIARLHQK